MARARGCILPAVLAGTGICWTVAERVAVAQVAAEVTEDIGQSYRLARWTTAHGSIIETLVFAGQTIVTDIAIPAPGAGKTTGTSGATPVVTAVNANASQSEAVAVPPGLGSGFTGTWLTGEIVDGYLVLHRFRANEPVAHDIFSEGQKVGSVTETDTSIRAGRLADRNSFAFERIDGRFVVHLRQPDGTTIHATTEHGRFLNQVTERLASVAASPRTRAGGTIVSVRQPEAVRPPVGQSPEPQRLAPPQEAAAPVMMKEPAPVALSQREIIPLPRPNPLPRIKAAMPTGEAPPGRPRPAIASVATERPSRPSKPSVRAEETATPVKKPKMSVATEDAQRPLRGAETPAAPTARPLPPPWDRSPPPWGMSAEKPVAPAARPSAPSPWNGSAEKPVTPAARPSPPSPWDTSVRYWQYRR
jgi:hypothetical protein